MFKVGDIVLFGKSLRGRITFVAANDWDEPRYEVHCEDFPEYKTFGLYTANEIRPVHPLVLLAEQAE